MSLQDSSDPGAAFIAILESTTLYDMLNRKGKLHDLPGDLKIMIQETQEYRSKSYPSLTKEQKESILNMNKRILKTTYAEIYPEEN